MPPISAAKKSNIIYTQNFLCTYDWGGGWGGTPGLKGPVKMVSGRSSPHFLSTMLHVALQCSMGHCGRKKTHES